MQILGLRFVVVVTLAGALAGVGEPGFYSPGLALSSTTGVTAGALFHQSEIGAFVAPVAGDLEVENQITDLHRRLSITPAQQSRFEALAQVMRQNAEAMAALAAQEQKTGKPNAVEMLRAEGRFAAANAEGVNRLVPALQALYDALSAQQQQIADEFFAAAPPEPAPGMGR